MSTENQNKYLADGSNYEVSLIKTSGMKIKDVVGYTSTEFGDDIPVFSITKIIFEDGSIARLCGEHDIAYLPSNEGQHFLTEDFLNDIKADD